MNNRKIILEVLNYLFFCKDDNGRFVVHEDLLPLQLMMMQFVGFTICLQLLQCFDFAGRYLERDSRLEHPIARKLFNTSVLLSSLTRFEQDARKHLAGNLQKADKIETFTLEFGRHVQKFQTMIAVSPAIRSYENTSLWPTRCLFFNVLKQAISLSMALEFVNYFQGIYQSTN